MKSRIVVSSLLILGMVLTSGGVGLAASNLTTGQIAALGNGTADSDGGGGGGTRTDGETGDGGGTVEVGGNVIGTEGVSPAAGDESDQTANGGPGADGSNGVDLAITGLAALPLIGLGLALLTLGVWGRRRSSAE